ncbi:uncharacterized protein LOC143058089 [Mytilus galloprovincialis]|uniref:uncharacterized protein LOC143058089 n=1 Tax=Mytilus galloprovincialis TaxID=29158 RepID=UPI003F7B9CD2
MVRVIWVSFDLVLIGAILFCPGAISQSTSSNIYGQQTNYKSALSPGLIESRTSNKATANAAMNQQFTNSTRLDAFHNQTSTFMPYHQIDPTLTGSMIIDHLRTLSPTDAVFGKQTTGEKPDHQIDPTLTGSIIDHLRTLTPTDAFSGQQITGENQIDSTLTDIMIDHLPTLTPTDAFSGQQITGENQIDPTLFGMIIDHLRTLSLTDAFSGQQITGENQIDSTLTDIMIDHLPTLTPTDAFSGQQITGENQIDPTLFGMIIDHLRTLSLTDAFSGQQITGENQIDSTLTDIMIDHLPTLTPIDAFLDQQSTGEKPDHQIESTLTGTMIDHPRTLSPTDAFSGQHSTDENPDHQIDSTLTGTTAHPRTLSPTNAFSGQQTSGEKTNHQIDSTVTATNINQQTEPTSNVKPLGNTQITTVTASFENKLRASTIDFAKTPTIVNTSLQFILKPSILISNNRPSFTASYEISGYQNVPTLTVSITNQPLTSTIEEKSRHILSTPSSMIDNHIFSTTLTIKETGHEIISSYTPFVFINTRASMSTDEVMSQNIVPSRTDKITLQPTDSKLTAALSKQTSSYQTRPVLNINLPDTSISNFGVTSQQIDSIPSGKISYQLTQATPTLEVTDTSTTQRSPQPSAQKTESNEPSQSGATNRTILSSMLTYSIYQSIQLSTTFIKSNQATTSPQTDSFSVLSASSLSSINWIGRSTTSTPSKKSKVSSKSRSHGVSQSMTPTVPTSTSTTTQSPLTKSPNEDATVDVPVTLFLDRSTNTSAEKSELQTELQKQYKNVTGYIGINIYIFRLVETGISNTRRRRQVKNN